MSIYLISKFNYLLELLQIKNFKGDFKISERFSKFRKF